MAGPGSAGEIARIELGKAIAEKLRVLARLAALPERASAEERAFLRDLLARAEERCRMLESAVAAAEARTRTARRD